MERHKSWLKQLSQGFLSYLRSVTIAWQPITAAARRVWLRRALSAGPGIQHPHSSSHLSSLTIPSNILPLHLLPSEKVGTYRAAGEPASPPFASATARFHTQNFHIELKALARRPAPNAAASPSQGYN